MKTIGLDLGTTKIAALCLETETGDVLKTVSVAHEARILSGNEWEHLQDPEVILRIASDLIDRIRADVGEIAAVGITGQMHGVLYFDETGASVSPLMTWLDRRAAQPFDGRLSYSDHIFRTTGYVVTPGFGIASHFYNARNGQVPSGACGFCTLSAYVAARLSGNRHPVTDPSDAASIGLFDLTRGEFDKGAARELGIDPGWLPHIVDWTDVSESSRTRPLIGLTVGDNQAGFLGSIQEPETMTLISVGTSGQISAFSRRPDAIRGLDTRPFPGGFLHVGATLSAGQSLAALAAFIRETVAKFGNTEATEIYERMNALALDAMSNEDRPTVDTRFAGSREDPKLRGSITGLSLANLTPGNLILGTVEGIVSELAALYARLPQDVRSTHTSIVGAGNGIRRNRIVRAVIEKSFLKSLKTPLIEEEAAMGAALLAAVQARGFENVRQACSLLRYTVHDGRSGPER